MRRIHAFLLLSTLAAVLPEGTAFAEDRVNQGSPLTAPANYPYGCETRWTPGYGGQPGAFGPGGAQEYGPETIGASTCSLTQLGPRSDLQQSHLVPGPGTVTTARVKAGADPLSVSIAIVRGYTGPDGFGGTTDTCCNQQFETPVVQLAPNAITTIPVNLATDTQFYDPQKKQVGFHDRVAVNVYSTSGQLPLSDLGPKPLQAPPGDPGALWFFPKFETGQNNQNQWTASGFEVLMNYDWCATGSTTAGCAGATGGGPTGGGPTGGGTGTTPPSGGGTTKPGAPAQLRGGTLARNGKSVGVRVRCTLATPCKGSVSLRSRGAKAFTLGKKRVSVGANKSATVKVPMSRKARSLLRRSSRVKVTATINLGSAGTAKKAFTLRGRKKS